MAQALLTTKQVMAGFSVSDMTLWTWRKGSKARDALPHHKDGRSVGFKESEMKAYGKKYSLTWAPQAAADALTDVKPGPKVKEPPLVTLQKHTVKRLPPAEGLPAKKKAKTVAQKMKSAATPPTRPPVVSKPRRPTRPPVANC